MLFKKLFASILVIASLMGLVGCGTSNSSASQNIIGKWSWSAEDGATIEFAKDKTVTAEVDGWTLTGKYKIQGDKLIIEFMEDGETETVTYSKLKIDGNNFSMYDDYDDYLITGHKLK